MVSSNNSIELKYDSSSSGGGTVITESISSISIVQSIFDIHYFEIKLRAEAIEGEEGTLFQKSKESTGKKIKIQLQDTVFIGFVTQVTISKKSSGFKGDLIIKGYSPGFILDDKPNTQSFTNCSLKDIVSQIKKVYPGNIINFNDDKITPRYQSKLDYVTQYNESGFQFISRLSADFGEWFYYNGTETIFGLPADTSPIKLFTGSDILNFDLSFQVQHINYKMQLYDYLKNETVNKSSNDAAKPDMDSLTDYAFNTSKNLTGFIPQYINGEVYNLDTPLTQVAGDMVNINTGIDASEFVVLTGVSTRSELKIGSVIEVRETSGADRGNEENLGDYRIISITHTSSGQGNYQNSFKAIPKALKFPPGNPVTKPVCPSQPAIVTDNNDSMGRVKVQFYWQKEKNIKTTWIRVLSSHAGNGRGFYFMPEIGDEVLVCFVDNDPDQPYVAGSLYHGKAKPHGSKDNNAGKSIITKGGNEIVFFDDKDNAEIQISNGDGKNIFTLQTGDDGRITLFSQGKVTINAQKNVEVIAGQDIKFMAKGIFEVDASQILLNAYDDLSGNNDFPASLADTHIGVASKGMSLKATDTITIESKQTAELKAGASLEIDGGTSAKLKASASLDIDGGAMASLKGAMVKIN